MKNLKREWLNHWGKSAICAELLYQKTKSNTYSSVISVGFGVDSGNFMLVSIVLSPEKLVELTLKTMFKKNIDRHNVSSSWHSLCRLNMVRKDPLDELFGFQKIFDQQEDLLQVL